MMQTLYEPPISYVKFQDRKIYLDTSFRRVLQCYSVLSDSYFSELEKIDLCIGLLVKRKYQVCFFSDCQKIDLFDIILKEFVDTHGKKSSGHKVFDFAQDAGYIYSSFMQCYGIDLLGKDRQLHWWKFIQLFNGLSDDSKIMQIISIRSRPMPKATKYNGEERRNLARLKALYRLDISEEDRERQLADGLWKMKKALEGMMNAKS